jgi:hypothetical protein
MISTPVGRQGTHPGGLHATGWGATTPTPCGVVVVLGRANRSIRPLAKELAWSQADRDLAVGRGSADNRGAMTEQRTDCHGSTAVR